VTMRRERSAGADEHPAARSRGLPASVAVLAVAFLLLPELAAAEDDAASVTATVTVTDPVGACILLGVTSVDFGTLAFGESSDSVAYTVESCSTADQTVYAATSPATDTAETVTWEPILSERTELDRFAVSAALDPSDRSPVRPDPDPVLLGTDPVRVDGLAAGATRQAVHHFHAPQPGSAGAGEVMTFQLIWTGVPDG
jgi:hypothetical protein